MSYTFFAICTNSNSNSLLRLLRSQLITHMNRMTRHTRHTLRNKYAIMQCISFMYTGIQQTVEQQKHKQNTLTPSIATLGNGWTWACATYEWGSLAEKNPFFGSGGSAEQRKTKTQILGLCQEWPEWKGLRLEYGNFGKGRGEGNLKGYS